MCQCKGPGAKVLVHAMALGCALAGIDFRRCIFYRSKQTGERKGEEQISGCLFYPSVWWLPCSDV